MPPVMEAPPREPQDASSQDVAELHLLIGEMRDELSAYRWREAVWISIVFHVLLCLSLIYVPRWIPKSAVIIPAFDPSNKEISFQLASPDQQHVKPPPTNIASDKNRIAQSRTPLPNKDQLRKLLDATRPGPPAPRPSPPQQSPQQQAAAQPAPQQQQANQQNAAEPPPQPTQTAQLQPPRQQPQPSFRTSAPGIEQAIQSVGASHGSTRYTFGGDYGSSRLQPNTDMRGDVEIMSDTLGVDFGPYLQRVLWTIKKNWYNLIPEVARPPIMKRGSLILHFSIMKDGRVAGLQYMRSSGDVALDRAAYGGITNSDPFDRLPVAFRGNYLELRIKFIYNSTSDDLN